MLKQEKNDSAEALSAVSLQKNANRIMRDSGLTVVYLAADGQWFSSRENAQKHSDDVEPQEFKLKIKS